MFVSYFVIFTCTVLFNTHLVSGKRGCASFGHSCFGGHGKRSQNGEIIPSEMLKNKDTNRHISLEHDDFSSPDRLPNTYDFFGKRDTDDVKSLLRKLVQFYKQKRLYKEQAPKYFNY